MAKNWVKSILTDNMDYCIICNRPRQATHHLLSGIANRNLSDKDKVIAPLCYDHHTGKHGIHTVREVEVLGKIIGQIAWEKQYLLDMLSEMVLEKNNITKNVRQVKVEEQERLNAEAREAFRDRYGKSLL